LLAEVAEDYGDPQAVAKEFDAIFERALRAHPGRSRAVVPASWLSGLGGVFETV
jgi:hypothetical protein